MDIVPDKIIKTFLFRIKHIIETYNVTEENASVQRELNRIKKINGEIPKEIQEYLNNKK